MAQKPTYVYPLTDPNQVSVDPIPTEVQVGTQVHTVESTTQPNPVSVIVPDATIYTLGTQGPAGPATGPTIETQNLSFIGSGTGSTKTVTDTNGNIIYESFGVLDELFVLWIYPQSLDRAVDPVFRGSFFPTGSEVGTFSSWEIHITAHSQTNGTEVSGTVYATDLPLADTAYEHAHGGAVISASTYLVDTDIIHIRLKRVASSNDPAAKVGVSDLYMEFGTDGRVGEQGPAGPAGGEEMPYARQIDFEDPYIYKGWADPGTTTSAGTWRIQRIEKVVDINGKTDYIYLWADGDSDFDNIWDNHLTLSYS